MGTSLLTQTAFSRARCLVGLAAPQAARGDRRHQPEELRVEEAQVGAGPGDDGAALSRQAFALLQPRWLLKRPLCKKFAALFVGLMGKPTGVNQKVKKSIAVKVKKG